MMMIIIILLLLLLLLLLLFLLLLLLLLLLLDHSKTMFKLMRNTMFPLASALHLKPRLTRLRMSLCTVCVKKN